ncbi:MAG: hypothetical protein Q4C89_10130 [Deinococcus sp.]|nr:hypothetical protein [Deinococcus sp.]MDO4246369.1 hypothetical protein [Deinococcus sp.]
MKEATDLNTIRPRALEMAMETWSTRQKQERNLRSALDAGLYD